MNLVPESFLSRRIHYIVNIVNEVRGKAFVTEEIASLMTDTQHKFRENVINLRTPADHLLWKVTLAKKTPHNIFLGPPTTKCYVCKQNLSVHNNPCTVVVFTLHGPSPALKITLRCDNCYRYNIICTNYLNPSKNCTNKPPRLGQWPIHIFGESHCIALVIFKAV